MPPTLADIARQTQTSVSTVSRVLAGGVVSRRISRETRDRVLKVADTLGYRPNLLARSLRTRRSNTVALLVSDIANPWFGQIASLIEKSLRRHGYSLMLCNSGEDPQVESEYLQLLPQKGIDGFIVVPLVRTKEELFAYLPSDLPVVVLDRPIPGIDASVAGDQDDLANILCDDMTRAGVTRVAIASGPQHVVTHRKRCQVVSSHFDVLAIHDGPAQKETGREAAARFKDLNIDAVVCTNNFLGQGLLDAWFESGRKNIVGCFDEIPMMGHLPIPILCSCQDVKLLAEACVDQLLPQLRGEATESEPVLIKPTLIRNCAFEAILKK